MTPIELDVSVKLDGIAKKLDGIAKKLDRIETLLEALVAIGNEWERKALFNGTPYEAPSTDTEPAQAPEPEPVEEAAPPWEDAAKPAHTIEELQTFVIKLVAGNDARKERVKGIVKSYASRVSDIPADKINEVWERLEGIQ